MTTPELPPLPEHTVGLGTHRWAYSSDDMREYATAALKAAQERIAELETRIADLKARRVSAASTAFLCIAPACGKACSDCNHAISPQQERDYAIRYAWLRDTPWGEVAPIIQLQRNALWDVAIDCAMAQTRSDSTEASRPNDPRE